MRESSPSDLGAVSVDRRHDSEQPSADDHRRAAQISRAIGAAVLLFGLVVALGTMIRYQDLGRGLIVLLCSGLFLGLWLTIAAGRRFRPGHAEPLSTVTSHRRGQAGFWGLAATAVAWLIVIGAILSPPSNPRGALLSLGTSAASCFVGFVCAIVGISDPATPRKSWCLAALVGSVALVAFVLVRVVVG